MLMKFMKETVFDYANYFEVRTKLKEENQKIILFDYDDEDLLPPTLYDLAALPENSLILQRPQETVKLKVHLYLIKSYISHFLVLHI